MTNLERLNSISDNEEMFVFLYYNNRNISSMKKIKSWLSQEVDEEYKEWMKL